MKSDIKKINEIYAKARNLSSFWAGEAAKLHWFKPWTKVLDKSKAPFYRWFVGGKFNIVDNAIDRHLLSLAEKTAIIHQDENGFARKLSYSELNKEVCKFANALLSLGVRKEDIVVTYLPNIPEQAITMLACAKIGALHSVVYAGFSAEALKLRIKDANAKIVVTADGNYRRGKFIPLKKTVDEAIKGTAVKHVIVVKRTKEKIKINKKDIFLKDFLKGKSDKAETAVLNATDNLFLLYTSGTTGKPKGVVHVHGGYAVGIASTLYHAFSLREDDIFWCTSDPGWITGHSYTIYAPLIHGVTTLIYEGVPDYPKPDAWWKVIEKYKVNVFYTTPTAIRAIMYYGDSWPKKHNLSSLRILGSVGEPIDRKSWLWYYNKIGKSKRPLIDTYWQTETGMFVICPLPGSKLKPRSASLPFPSIKADIVDDKFHSLGRGKQGMLVLKTPWPAMLKTLYRNKKRYKQYWHRNLYITGDIAKRDKEGYYFLLGRSDDVLKIAGHRLSSAEIESAINSNKAVVESAVIGVPHPIKGEVAKVFAVLKKGFKESEELKQELRQDVREKIGPIAIVDKVEFVEKLPKTRSGKIMRRLLKAKELGKKIGDISALED